MGVGHAKLSASGSERWLNCPASVALSERAPPDVGSEYAKEGTDAHSCLEMILKNHGGKPYTAARMLEGKYPREMIEHALKAYKEIEARIPAGATLLCETKVDLSHVGPDMYGTVDSAIIDHFGRLWVIDYKYGAGVPVDPEENTQLIYYALGLAHKYDYNFADVALVIIQPRAPHERGPIREWVMTIDELRAWTPKFKQGVEAAKDPLAPFRCGDWCRWCPAASICPEISNKAMAQAQIDFSDDGSITALPAVPTIQIPNLSKILTACDLLETWIEKVRTHALNAARRNEKIAGWKLVDKRSTRKWINVEQASKKALKIFGKDAFSEPELLSPAQLEKAVSKEAAAEFIAKNASDVSSGVTLVPESDKRPAVNQIEEDFGELPDGRDPVLEKISKQMERKPDFISDKVFPGKEGTMPKTKKKTDKKTPAKKATKTKKSRK